MFLAYSEMHEPAVAMISNDEFVVAWVAQRFLTGPGIGELFGTTTEEVLARRFRVDGTPLGDAVIVDRRTFVGPAISLIDFPIRIVRNPAGGYAIGYTNAVPLVSNSGDAETALFAPFRVRTYSSDGRPTSLPQPFISAIQAAGLH